MIQKRDGIENKLRGKVVWAAQLMYKKGYVIGTAGNISARIPGINQLLITPSGAPYETMHNEDVVLCDLEGNKIAGKLKPSSELSMHVGLYKARPEIEAIIHTHSIYASALAVNQTEIPFCLDEMYFSIGANSIPVAKYGKSGSVELADNIVKAIGHKKKAVLMSNHGTVAIGLTMEEAFDICEVIEKTAMIFTYAKLTGKINTLEKYY